MWENWEEFREALEGEFGEEEQEDALDFAEDAGLLDDAEEAEPAGAEGEIDESYVEALRQEVARVEGQIGRQLTKGEINGLLDTLSTEDVEQGTVPDFSDEFGATLATARHHESGREHLGAEAAQAVFDEQAAQGQRDTGALPQPRFEIPDDGPGDYEQ